MFNTNKNRKRIITREGIVMTPSWTDTLLHIKPGQSLTFDRRLIKPGNIRSVVSKVQRKSQDIRFAVRTIGQDDAVEVTRIK